MVGDVFGAVASDAAAVDGDDGTVVDAATVDDEDDEDVIEVVGATAALWGLEQPVTTSKAAGHSRNHRDGVIGPHYRCHKALGNESWVQG